MSFVFFAAPAAAISADDVLNKMEKKERLGYLTGLVDMLSYQAVLAGNRARAECIHDAFYVNKSVWDQLIDLLGQYPDKAPEGLVVVLTNRACSK